MAAVQPSKAALAEQAVAARPDSSPTPDALMSPGLESILAAFKQQGGEDKEMLKLLLQAKAKEDERLAALDLLRAEQLRAANSIAMQQYYMQYLAAAQLYAHQNQPFKGPPPYSPGSPPPALLSPAMPHAVPVTGKRPRATSDASISSVASDGSSSSSSKKAKTSSAGSISSSGDGAPRRPSHEDVMAALRRKCGANQQQDGQQYLAPPSSAHAAASYFPALAPRTSHSPPLVAPQTTTARRNSPPHIPGRHTSFLRPAAPPTASPPIAPLPATSAPLRTSPGPAPPASLATVHEEEAAAPPPPATASSAPRNKLALLLHASESTDGALPPTWEPPKPKVIAATSDVRGEA